MRHSLASVLCAVVAGAAQAQSYVSGSISVLSDYRWRGYSLTDGRPAIQATLAFDHSGGAYAGLFVGNVRFGAAADPGVQGLGYAGYSGRLAGGLSWDLGATYTDFSRPRGYGYAEYHIGLAQVAWSARLSHAPRYFGRPSSASYAELNLTPWSDRVLVPLLHVGLLQASRLEYLDLHRSWDAKIGLAYSAGLTTVQLSWSTASSERTIAGTYADRSGWVLRLTRWL